MYGAQCRRCSVFPFDRIRMPNRQEKFKPRAHRMLDITYLFAARRHTQGRIGLIFHFAFAKWERINFAHSKCGNDWLACVSVCVRLVPAAFNWRCATCDLHRWQPLPERKTIGKDASKKQNDGQTQPHNLLFNLFRLFFVTIVSIVRPQSDFYCAIPDTPLLNFRTHTHSSLLIWFHFRPGKHSSCVCILYKHWSIRHHENIHTHARYHFQFQILLVYLSYAFVSFVYFHTDGD